MHMYGNGYAKLNKSSPGSAFTAHSHVRPCDDHRDLPVGGLKSTTSHLYKGSEECMRSLAGFVYIITLSHVTRLAV